MIIDMGNKEYKKARNALDKLEGKTDRKSLDEQAHWKRELNKNR